MCLAIPAQIVQLFPESDLATADVSGIKRNVNIGLLEGQNVATGDWVLIHVGFAMSKIRQQDADEQLRMLTALGEAEAAMEEVRGYSTDDTDPHPKEHPQPKERSFP